MADQKWKELKLEAVLMSFPHSSSISDINLFAFETYFDFTWRGCRLRISERSVWTVANHMESKDNVSILAEALINSAMVAIEERKGKVSGKGASHG